MSRSKIMLNCINSLILEIITEDPMGNAFNHVSPLAATHAICPDWAQKHSASFAVKKCFIFIYSKPATRATVKDLRLKTTRTSLNDMISQQSVLSQCTPVNQRPESVFFAFIFYANISKFHLLFKVGMRIYPRRV